MRLETSDSEVDRVLKRLKAMGNPECVAGMASVGINPNRNLGVSMASLKKAADDIGKNHDLALKLWSTGIRDARILAVMIDDPNKVTERQMDSWANDFDSWDVCDACCMHLFDRTRFAYSKAREWSLEKKEFVRRAGFALIATLAIHDKKSKDEVFEKFLPIVIKGSTDDRNYVKKAVNWALRQIGKRSLALNKKAISAARKIQKLDSKSARWVASDALRELTSDRVLKKLARKKN